MLSVKFSFKLMLSRTKIVLNHVKIPICFSDAVRENISKNYLQELFGSFPFSEAGGFELPGAANSDEEYQIYEQYSDGNYSGDDDY